jgi:sulfur dioxygenase
MLSKQSNGKADIHIDEGDLIKFGNEHLLVLATPGHTNGCLSFVSHKAKIIFTGDALLIRSCGRTDFQLGNSSSLYDSIHNKILTLPDEYIVFPGHDYNGTE